MELFEFKDVKTTPDPIYDYPASLRTSGTPLIIDNGSYQCRVGWMHQDTPILSFKSVIAKPRKERSKKDGELPVTPQIQVGNDITNLEAVRFQLKTQFDRNIVTHFEAQEHIFDYMFTHLGINNECSVPHPIVITEAFLNPNYSRQLTSELLFECYGVPSVAYGVDALFGYFHTKVTDKQNGLIVHIGYHNIHIIPVLNGNVIYKNSRRINTGGQHVIIFLHRLLQLKYPAHSAAITLGRAEELLHRYCHIAYDYHEELQKWSSNTYYEENTVKIQLPYTAAVPVSGLTLEQQKERKKELAKRLMEMNARKREERLAEYEEKLNQLQSIMEVIEDGDEDEISQSLVTNGFKSEDELQKTMQIFKTKIERTKQKINASNNEEIVVEDKPSKVIKLDPMAMEDMQGWLLSVKNKRQEILNKKAARKQKRNDMAKRRTVAAQERMRIISQLARKEKGNDDFGMRDEDWDVYKTISRDGGDSDSELENEKLLEYDEILRQHEPNFENNTSKEPGETHQLHIGIERFRAPELLFQPSMTGSIEAGLSETISYVLSLFSAEEQQLLVNNIILSGGCASLPGIKERLNRELKENRPFKSTFTVIVAENPELCGWIGAKNWAKSTNLQNYSVNKNEYLEYGGEYFKEHKASNFYLQSPKASIITEVE